MKKIIKRIVNWWNYRSEANISKYTHVKGNYDPPWNCPHVEGVDEIDNLVKERTEIEINQRKEDEWK